MAPGGRIGADGVVRDAFGRDVVRMAGERDREAAIGAPRPPAMAAG